MKRDRDDFEGDEIGPSRSSASSFRILSPESATYNFPPPQTNNSNPKTNNNNNSTTNINKEQDRFLPIANVGRIMKKVIPGNGKISKEAKETVQECVSEFISFVTGEASDKCQREKRKTINGDDILWAITTLGFEDYVHPLKVYLAKYRDIEGEKLNIPKQQHDHNPNNPNISYNTSLFSSTPTFDPQFPLPFSQNSMQSQQDHIDHHW